jgi:hypothetical protein
MSSARSNSPRNKREGRGRLECHEDFIAAARDAVGEEPIAAGGVHALRVAPGASASVARAGEPEFAPRSTGRVSKPKPETFTTARDAVGSEEPIAMGGW